MIMFNSDHRKLVAASVAAIASALLLFDGGFAQAQQPKQGGSLSVGIETDQTSLDPLAMSSFIERQGGMLLYDTLLTMDAKGAIVPNIAEKIETAEDATSFKLTLRKGVKFADDTDYDAAAVTKNFLRIMDPKNKCKCASEVAAIDKVEATRTLDHHLQQFGRRRKTELGPADGIVAVGDRDGAEFACAMRHVVHRLLLQLLPARRLGELRRGRGGGRQRAHNGKHSRLLKHVHGAVPPCPDLEPV